MWEKSDASKSGKKLEFIFPGRTVVIQGGKKLEFIFSGEQWEFKGGRLNETPTHGPASGAGKSFRTSFAKSL